jgi:tRNA(Ile)-lysidine synthase
VEIRLALAQACRFDAAGGVTLPRAALRTGAPAEARRLLAMACVCVGGDARPPASAARDSVAERLCGDGRVVATLAGARVEADRETVRIVREAGEARRGGLQPLGLSAGAAAVWDGRFEISAAQAIEVRPLRGLTRRLPDDQRRALAGWPAAVRGGLPAIIAADGAVGCPLLGASPARVQSLVEARLLAAAGLVERER